MRYTINSLILLTLIFCTPAHAAPQENKQLAPDAIASLQKAVDFLEGLDQFEIHGKAIYDDIQDNGQRLQFERSTRIVLQRPNKLYAERLRDDGDLIKLWYDSGELSILKAEENAYAQLRAPESIDGMLDMLEGLFREPHPLADLLYSDLSPLLQLPDVATLVGSSSVSGYDCDHLAFRNAALDWQIWVERSATPFIRKVVITYRNQPGVPQFVSYLQNWDATGKADAEIFSFIPPEDAEKVSILLPPQGKAEEGAKQ